MLGSLFAYKLREGREMGPWVGVADFDLHFGDLAYC